MKCCFVVSLFFHFAVVNGKRGQVYGCGFLGRCRVLQYFLLCLSVRLSSTLHLGFIKNC